MKAYSAYKAWWIKHQAPGLVPSLYWGETEEQAFRQHVNDLGVHGLMETLVDW